MATKPDPKDTTGAAALQKAEEYVKHPRTKLAETTKEREARETKEKDEKEKAETAAKAKTNPPK